MANTQTTKTGGTFEERRVDSAIGSQRVDGAIDSQIVDGAIGSKPVTPLKNTKPPVGTRPKVTSQSTQIRTSRH